MSYKTMFWRVISKEKLLLLSRDSKKSNVIEELDIVLVCQLDDSLPEKMLELQKNFLVDQKLDLF
jgi:hypothetical protein